MYEIVVINVEGAAFYHYTDIVPFMKAYKRLTDTLRDSIVSMTIGGHK